MVPAAGVAMTAAKSSAKHDMLLHLLRLLHLLLQVVIATLAGAGSTEQVKRQNK